MMRYLMFIFVMLIFAPVGLRAQFAFWVGIGPASKLVFSIAPSATASADAPFSTQPTVAITDFRYRLLTGQTNAIQLSAYTDSNCTSAAGGVLSATTNPLNASGGLATFSGLSYSQAGTIYLKASASGLSSACSSAIVVSASTPAAPGNMPTPKKFLVTREPNSLTPNIAATNECVGLKVSLVDYWNLLAATPSNVTMTLLENGSGIYYSDANCSSSMVTAQILQNQSSTMVYFKNSTTETNLLTFLDQSGDLLPTHFQLTFYSTKLTLTGPQAVLNDGGCYGPYTIQYLNGDNTSAGTITVTIDGFQQGSGGGTSSIHTGATCSAGGGKITAPVSVNGTYNFYYKSSTSYSIQVNNTFTATPSSSPPMPPQIARLY